MSSPSPATAPKDTLSPFFFPDELLGVIFGHCDKQTLANVSRASFACLELSSKHLYEDIVLGDARSIAKLFRLSTPNSSAIVPLSTRVSAHTSLSLMHSFTCLGRGDLDVGFLDRCWPFPEPLAIAVFAVSLPTKVRIIGRPNVVDIREVLDLVNPRMFILRGRRAALRSPVPDLTANVNLGGFSADSGPPWNRLETIVQSGAALVGPYAYGYQGCLRDSIVALDGKSRLRVIYDFLDVDADPSNKLRNTGLAFSMDHSIFYSNKADSPEEVRAWVGTDAIKVGLLASKPRVALAESADMTDRTVDLIVDVPSDRLRRLRTDILKGGISKRMDWGALEQL